MKKIIYVATIALLIITLILGLSFKGESLKNTISVSDESLKFVNNSFAITNLQLSKKNLTKLNQFGFKFGFEIKPNILSSKKVKFLLRLKSSNNKKSSFNIFFWKNKLTVNLDDDYEFRYKAPRVVIILDEEKRFLEVVVGKNLISVYLDEKLMGAVNYSSEDFNFESSNYEILLGGNLIGRKSWRGEIFQHSFSALVRDISSPNKSINALDFIPIYDFKFGHKEGNEYIDLNSGSELIVPKYPIFYDRVLMRDISFNDFSKKISFFDITVNFFWFFFLSILVFLSLLKIGYSSTACFWLSFLLLSFFSLVIEYMQSWLPMRDSSVRDLLLNSIGAGIGSLLVYIISFYYRAYRKD